MMVATAVTATALEPGGPARGKYVEHPQNVIERQLRSL